MTALAAIAWWLGCGITAATIAYILLALASVLAFRPRQAGGWGGASPATTVLKPLYGTEDGLEHALESCLSQAMTSPVRFVFGAADATDPGLALARQVAARHPGCRVEFVADATVHGPNPKVSNLINMARSGLDDVVIISDSDTVIGPGALQRTIDALSEPGTGAVTALFRGRPGIAGNRSRAFGAWFIDYWMVPMTVLYDRLSPLAVTHGPLTAVRREALEKAGGLAAMAPHLSDDAALGTIVRRAGYSISLAPDAVETLVNDAGAGELFGHELRWARSLRGLDPLGFAATLVSHPGPLPLLLLVRPGVVSLALILSAIILRWLLVLAVERRFGRAPGMIRPGPVGVFARDCFCFAVWATAFVVGRVGWRGQDFSIERRDLLRTAKTREPAL